MILPREVQSLEAHAELCRSRSRVPAFSTHGVQRGGTEATTVKCGGAVAAIC